MRRTIFAIAAMSALLSACASKGGSSSPGAVATPSGQSATDPSRLTRAEIDAADLPNVYELVSRLRRPWLRRDGATGAEPVVYMDERKIGGVEKLRDIPAVQVAELQYVANADAIRRWGSSITGAVIVVVRRG